MLREFRTGREPDNQERASITNLPDWLCVACIVSASMLIYILSADVTTTDNAASKIIQNEPLIVQLDKAVSFTTQPMTKLQPGVEVTSTRVLTIAPTATSAAHPAPDQITASTNNTDTIGLVGETSLDVTEFDLRVGKIVEVKDPLSKAVKQVRINQVFVDISGKILYFVGTDPNDGNPISATNSYFPTDISKLY